jgi:hypothetical protein
MDRLNVGQLPDLLPIAPCEKFPRGAEIGDARVVVLDLRGEEIQEAVNRVIAGCCDQHRHNGVQCYDDRGRDFR